MKWVIFISILSLVSFAELKNLPRRYRHVDDDATTIKLASQITDGEFASVAITLYAQTLQCATFEEVGKLVEAITAFSKKCAADGYSDQECTKPLHTVFLDILCHEEELSEKYGINACCAKADPERNECILSHKNYSVGFIPPFVHPTPEDGCNAYRSSRKDVLSQFLYQFARRNPGFLVVLILHAAHIHDVTSKDCCEATDKAACFQEKATEAKKKFREIISEMEVTCFTLNNYGKDTLYILKLIEAIERFPNANLATVSHIAKDVVEIHEETCKGDTMASLIKRVKLSDYVCANKNTISSKIDPCCEKSLVERTQCLAHIENDEMTVAVTPSPEDHISGTVVCKFYADQGEEYFEIFLINYMRSHPEKSKLLDMEIFQGYKALVKKCCTEEDPSHCLRTGVEQLKLFVANIYEVVKKNCDHYNKIGKYFFQNEYLVKYSKIMPQLPSSNMIDFTKKLTNVAEKCCNLDTNHQVSCALEHTDKTIGSICAYHKEHHINKQICNCCDHSFIKRWECFTKLGTDPDYVPPPFKPKILEDPEVLCSSDLQIVQDSKQGLLIDMIKSMPNITDTQLANAIVGFTALQVQCCEAENKNDCFGTEGKKLIEQIQTDAGAH